MAGVHINTLLASVLAEKDSLVSSFAAELPGGRHATTVGALRDFMNQFGGEGSIPWVRMYESLRPGSSDENWDRNVVPERAKVIFTLVTPLGQGRTFSREALGGGKWKSKGAETIGNRVVLTKLYFNGGGPRDGFTAFEFHLANDQPRVALCVLHWTDYRHCVWDLGQYIQQASYDHPSTRSSWEALPPPAPLDVISQHLFSENDSPELGGQHSDADVISIENDFRNLL